MAGKWDAAVTELLSDSIEPTNELVFQRLKDMFPELFEGTEGRVPSILRLHEQGWPEGFRGVSADVWNKHILYLHGPDGKKGSRFDDSLSPYEIARIVRAACAEPSLVVPHPTLGANYPVYLKEINGTVYQVGTRIIDDEAFVNTAFPPGRGSPIMRIWNLA